MFSHSKKTYNYPNRKNSWHQLYFPIAVILFTFIVAGCNSTSSKQLYENSESGIRLERPGNWELAYNERNGIIVLVTESGIWNKGSVRIEVHGPACRSISTKFNGPSEEIEWNIDRIQKLYNLESVTIIQEPVEVKSGDYEVTKATIVIPTMALENDPTRNQVGNQDASQTIDMFAITHDGNTLMTYIYRGNSEALNTQAQEIIDSIQITCSTEP